LLNTILINTVEFTRTCLLIFNGRGNSDFHVYRVIEKDGRDLKPL